MIARRRLLAGVDVRRRRAAHVRAVDLRGFLTDGEVLLRGDQRVVQRFLPFDPRHFILREDRDTLPLRRPREHQHDDDDDDDDGRTTEHTHAGYIHTNEQ